MIGRTRWHFTEVDSTQNVAFRLAELSAPHGTVVRADFQSAGRGRQGRSWDAPHGSSLMFSTILRPEAPLHELGTVSLLVAHVLADVFSEITSDPVQIKWPNDVLIAGRKVSGILMQTRSSPSPVAVLGIGINTDSSRSALSDAATSLDQHVNCPIDNGPLLESIIHRLDTMWTNWQPEMTPRQAEQFDARLWMVGQQVSLLDANRKLTGRILGVAKNGGLRLSVDGVEQVVMAGEITRGPRPIEKQEVN